MNQKNIGNGNPSKNKLETMSRVIFPLSCHFMIYYIIFKFQLHERQNRFQRILVDSSYEDNRKSRLFGGKRLMEGTNYFEDLDFILIFSGSLIHFLAYYSLTIIKNCSGRTVVLNVLSSLNVIFLAFLLSFCTKDGLGGNLYDGFVSYFGTLGPSYLNLSYFISLEGHSIIGEKEERKSTKKTRDSLFIFANQFMIFLFNFVLSFSFDALIGSAVCSFHIFTFIKYCQEEEKEQNTEEKVSEFSVSSDINEVTLKKKPSKFSTFGTKANRGKNRSESLKILGPEDLKNNLGAPSVEVQNNFKNCKFYYGKKGSMDMSPGERKKQFQGKELSRSLFYEQESDNKQEDESCNISDLTMKEKQGSDSISKNREFFLRNGSVILSGKPTKDPNPELSLIMDTSVCIKKMKVAGDFDFSIKKVLSKVFGVDKDLFYSEMPNVYCLKELHYLKDTHLGNIRTKSIQKSSHFENNIAGNQAGSISIMDPKFIKDKNEWSVPSSVSTLNEVIEYILQNEYGYEMDKLKTSRKLVKYSSFDSLNFFEDIHDEQHLTLGISTKRSSMKENSAMIDKFFMLSDILGEKAIIEVYFHFKLTKYINSILNLNDAASKKHVPSINGVSNDVNSSPMTFFNRGKSKSHSKILHSERNGREPVFLNKIYMKVKFQKEASFKEKEDKKESDIAKVVSLIAHEVRAPIKGVLDLMDHTTSYLRQFRGQLSKGLFDDLDFCISKSVSLLSILLETCSCILEVVKPDQSSIKCGEFDLRVVIDDVKLLFRSELEGKKLEFIVEYDDNVSNLIRSDPIRLRQILINLVSNAIKYTKNGKIFVKVKKDEESEKNSIKIEVQDTGLGIKEEDCNKLFKEFGRIKNKQDLLLNSQGVGLGLNLSNELAKILSPDKSVGIQVHSVWRKGTTFWFNVEDKFANEIERELYQQPDDEFNKSNFKSFLKKKSESMPKSLKKELFHVLKIKELILKKGLEYTKKTLFPRVLVVDDNEFMLNIVKSHFSKFKIEIDTFVSPYEAIENIIERKNSSCKACKRYGLILVDYEMPFMNGANFCKSVKSMSGYQDIPIVCASADDKKDSKSGNKFDLVLKKPISQRDIRKLVLMLRDSDKDLMNEDCKCEQIVKDSSAGSNIYLRYSVKRYTNVSVQSNCTNVGERASDLRKRSVITEMLPQDKSQFYKQRKPNSFDIRDGNLKSLILRFDDYKLLGKLIYTAGIRKSIFSTKKMDDLFLDKGRRGKSEDIPNRNLLGNAIKGKEEDLDNSLRSEVEEDDGISDFEIDEDILRTDKAKEYTSIDIYKKLQHIQTNNVKFK